MVTSSLASYFAADRLSALDASFLYLERSTEPLHVGAVMLLEGSVPFERFVSLLGERLDPLRRYRQRPVRPPLDLALPRWMDDPAFDVRRHVHQVRLPAPGGEAELHAVVDRLFATPCDAAMPLWETYLIEGLAGGRAAVLTKVHHCMIDGVSGAKVLEVMTDPGPAAAGGGEPERGIAAPTAAAGLPGGLQAILDVVRPSAVIEGARGLFDAARALTSTFGAPPDPTVLNGALGADRGVAWTAFPLDTFLAVRGAAGCKVNDVVLAVIAGALRRYFIARGITPPAGMRSLVPVNVRRGEDALNLGNRVSALFATLPVDVADPVERLARVVKETRALKAAGQSRALETALAIAGMMPAPSGPLLARLGTLRPLVHTVCTNIPGPRETRFVLGRRVLEMHPLVPLAIGMGVGFAILSYDGLLSITATSDPALVPGVAELPAMLRQSLDELIECTGSAPVRVPAAAAGHTTTVADLMTADPVVIGPHDTLAVAWTAMRERRIRHLPVVERDGKVVGLVTHRDLLAASQSSLTVVREDERVRFLGAATASEIMETHLSIARPDEPAADAGTRMVRQKIGCIPVVAEDGRLAGIVTEEDFLRWATDQMAASAA
ncbi:MAG TPA: wax ester/triacylglycerol synthase family O-acyltransferase [Candidatus Binatia bacterium]|jgi:WS/DGAT/MGAT family acyltransferase